MPYRRTSLSSNKKLGQDFAPPEVGMSVGLGLLGATGGGLLGYMIGEEKGAVYGVVIGGGAGAVLGLWAALMLFRDF